MTINWSTPAVNPFSGGRCTTVAIGSGVFLAGGNDSGHTHSVAVSLDGGITWNTPAVDPFAGGGAGAANAVTVAGSVLVAAGTMAGNAHTIAYSGDNGVTWVYPGTDPFYNGSADALCASSTGSVIVAGGFNGTNTLAVSTNGGASWSSPSTDPFAGGECAALACSSDGSVILAGGNNGAFTKSLAYSTNSGATWSTISSDPFAGFICQAVSVSSDGTVLAAGNLGGGGATHFVAVSTNSGSTWSTPSSDPFGSGGFCDAIVVSPDKSRIIAGGANGASTHTLAYSTNNGTSWTSPVTDPFNGGFVNAVACSSNAGTIVAGGQNGAATETLAVSSDGGATWVAPTSDPFSGQQAFVVASSSGGTALLAGGKVTNSLAFVGTSSTTGLSPAFTPPRGVSASLTGLLSNTAAGLSGFTRPAGVTATTSATAVAQTATGTAPYVRVAGVAAGVTASVPASVIAPSVTGYAYLASTSGFRAVPSVTVPVATPPTCEPNNLAPIYQVSETYNQPTVINGLPYANLSKAAWGPASVTRTVWAKQLQVVVGGQDVTFFRCVPTIVGTWSSQEPFADGPATFTLPAVTTFDGLPAPAALPTGEVVGIATSYTGEGYWQAAAEGLVSAYGDAAYLGDPLGLLAEPVSGIGSHPSGYGYAMCAQDGGVFCFGDVSFHGNAIGLSATPIVGIALSSTGNGYWLVAADGGVFAFGDAVFHGSAFGSVGYPTNQITGIARSGGGAGYVLVASNGGVFCYGDATFHGNGIGSYQAELTGVATHPGTDGYVLCNAVGSAYAFGSCPYEGGVPPSIALAQPVNSIAITPSGNGYWMSAGDGGVFTYGDAPFYGSIPGGGINVFGSLSWLRMGAPVTIYRIDNSGNPHTLWEGIVADWEDTTAPGQTGLQVQCVGTLFQADWYVAKPVVDLPFLGFNPQTNLPVFGWDIGTAIAQAFNSVHNPSAGTALGTGPQPAPNGSPANFGMCTPVNTGILTVTRGNWDQLASGYLQNMLAQAQNLGGYQWTVNVQRPRTPVITTKNLTSTNWTVTAGARGVATQLSFDQSTAANAIYGQGQAPPVLAAPGTGLALTGAWANAAYPQAYAGTAPTFPLGSSASFAPGDGQTGMQPFTNWMRQSGVPLNSQDTYMVTNQATATFDQYLIEAFQQNAGLQVTGNVDTTTWTAAFATGTNVGAIANSYYQPLWQLPQVEPYTYSPSGAVVGKNPFFNANVPRVERYEQMGQQLTKAQGVVSARIEGTRIQTPSWTGTITLTADPQEGSRFDIHAGQNIMVQWFRGRDTLFHISQVSVDFTSLKVTLTVSSQAQDLMTLQAIWDRDSQSHGTARVARPTLVSLNVSTNTTVFDAESGAGRIFPTSLTASQWTVQRVPFSESGSVALADFSTSPATPFAIGVFSAPVTASQLAGVFGTVGPLTADAAGNNPWNDYALVGNNGGPGLDTYGLLYGAGGPNGPCGYWPSDPNGVQTLTGRYVDSQTWPYASAPGYVPWVWVALWASGNCTVSGRFLVAPLQGS